MDYRYKHRVAEYEVFANRLRCAIVGRGYTLRDFAKKMNMGEVTLSEYVRARRMPPSDILRQMCEELKVSADYLLDLEDLQCEERTW